MDLDEVENGLLRRSADRHICAIPASLPLVHTFVARKTRGRNPISATRSPTTVSALPYIGEVSIRRAPAPVNRVSTSFSGMRAAALLPTSKACQVPSLMTGIASPEDGIGRVIISAVAIALFSSVGHNKVAAPAAPSNISRRPIIVLRLHDADCPSPQPSPRRQGEGVRGAAEDGRGGVRIRFASF